MSSDQKELRGLRVLGAWSAILRVGLGGLILLLSVSGLLAEREQRMNYALAEAYVQAGIPERAAALLDRVEAEAREDSRFWLLRAEVAFALGDAEKTREALARAESAAGADETARQRAALAARLDGVAEPEAGELGDTRLSPQSLPRAQMADDAELVEARRERIDAMLPNIAPADELGREVQVLRARLFAGEGAYADAEAALRAVLDAFPRDDEALLLLVGLYLDMEAWGKLEQLGNTLAGRSGLEAVAAYVEGRIALARDRVGTARSRFEQALRMAGDQPALAHTARFYRGQALIRLERMEEGISEIGVAVDDGFTPASISEKIVVAHHFLRTGDLPRALYMLETELENTAVLDARFYWALGTIYEEGGMSGFAAEAYREAVERDPQDTQAVLRLASLLRRGGYAEEALDQLQLALQVEGPVREVLLLGLILAVEIGAFDEAVRIYEQDPLAFRDRRELRFFGLLALYLTGAQAVQQSALERMLDEERFLLALMAGEVPDPASWAKQGVDPLFISLASVWRGDLPAEAFWEMVQESAEADTDPAQMRRSYARMAFWLAQVARQLGDSSGERRFLSKAEEQSNPGDFVYHAARWQMNARKRQSDGFH